jgi:hypothetical protein
MSFFEKPRWAVFNQRQHPLKHDLSEFFYSNPRLPAGFSSVSDALDYIMASLYPNYKGTAATPAGLPGVATNNDYWFVTDDGDGKSAGYVYTVLDGVSQWIKRYDVDWSLEGILAETITRTQYMYVHKYGFDDHDALGVPLVGTLAGQQIFGGTLTNTNLTLNANSFDDTGYVQTRNHFRPTTDNLVDLGTATEQFRTLRLGTSAIVGTLTLAPASITDSIGAISFGDENLSTTGNVSAVTGTFSTSALIGTTLSLGTGSITDSSGAISFGNENLSTTGTLASGTHTIGTLVLAAGSITDTSGNITFDNENLLTTGTLGAGNTTVTRLDSDNIRIDGNTISVLDLNGSLIIQANGTGIVDVQNPLQTLGQTVTGTVGITGQLNIDNLRLDGNVISSTNLNGNITLTPNGAGLVQTSANLVPTTDGTLDLGAIATRYASLFLGTGISDGTTSITSVTLQSLRDINVGVAAGMTIFWNGTKWVASAPDTEIDHGTISGLSDDDHTQYMLLAGRAGGQTLNGGNATTENLTLKANSADTTGTIIVSNTVTPNTDNTKDLGSGALFFKDLYTKGQAKNLRFENFTTAGLPASSALNIGRVMWDTDVNKAYVDTGTTLKVLGVSKYLSDTAWVAQTTQDFTVSASISDARNAIWAIYDNANDFEQMFVSLKAISATQVRVTFNIAQTATYRLIGIE